MYSFLLGKVGAATAHELLTPSVLEQKGKYNYFSYIKVGGCSSFVSLYVWHTLYQPHVSSHVPGGNLLLRGHFHPEQNALLEAIREVTRLLPGVSSASEDSPPPFMPRVLNVPNIVTTMYKDIAPLEMEESSFKSFTANLYFWNISRFLIGGYDLRLPFSCAGI